MLHWFYTLIWKQIQFFRMHIFTVCCIKSWNSQNKNNFQSNMHYIFRVICTIYEYYLQQKCSSEKVEFGWLVFTVVVFCFFLSKIWPSEKPPQRSNHHSNSRLTTMQVISLKPSHSDSKLAIWHWNKTLKTLWRNGTHDAEEKNSRFVVV